jgi:hypothetical protein
MYKNESGKTDQRIDIDISEDNIRLATVQEVEAEFEKYAEKNMIQNIDKKPTVTRAFVGERGSMMPNATTATKPTRKIEGQTSRADPEINPVPVSTSTSTTRKRVQFPAGLVGPSRGGGKKTRKKRRKRRKRRNFDKK